VNGRSHPCGFQPEKRCRVLDRVELAVAERAWHQRLRFPFAKRGDTGRSARASEGSIARRRSTVEVDREPRSSEPTDRR
jgi:hypothetical protein